MHFVTYETVSLLQQRTFVAVCCITELSTDNILENVFKYYADSNGHF